MYIPEKNVLQTRIRNPEDILTSRMKNVHFLQSTWEVCLDGSVGCASKKLADKEKCCLDTLKKWQLLCFWHDGWNKTDVNSLYFSLCSIRLLSPEKAQTVLYIYIAPLTSVPVFLFDIACIFYQGKHCRLKAPGCQDLNWAAEPDFFLFILGTNMSLSGWIPFFTPQSVGRLFELHV